MTFPLASRLVQGPMTQDRSKAARQLFRYTAGVLNGTFAENRCLEEDCLAAVREWLEHTSEDDAPQLPAQALAWALEALVAAIETGAVPPKGLLTLCKMRARFADCKLVGADLDAQGQRVLEAMAVCFDRLAAALDAGKVAMSQWDDCVELSVGLEEALDLEMGALFVASVRRRLCPRCSTRCCASIPCQRCKGSGCKPCSKCSGTGKFSQPCRTCNGRGRTYSRSGNGASTMCTRCDGRGSIVMGDCNRCRAGEDTFACDACDDGRAFCQECFQAVEAQLAQEAAEQKQRAEEARRRGPRSAPTPAGPPAEGVTIERASGSSLAYLQKLWQERGGPGQVLEAWSIDNPLLAYKFRERKAEIERVLGRSDLLEGFHGSSEQNFLPIVQQGFRSDLRAGQVFGSGEYFAKNPSVSVGYCSGGKYMLVCSLCLGLESSSKSNSDGDHIWVPENQYYVISKPAQILPRYLVKFGNLQTRGYGYNPSPCHELGKVLSAGTWSTKKEEAALELPPNRPCLMSRATATVLWMGLMRAENSDQQLEADVRAFFARHAPDHTEGLKIQIVRGTFKKAHAILAKPMPKDLVHKLNKVAFIENGKERTLCVDDAHGSPEQKCPKFIAKYCRGQNLRYTHPCWCWHPKRETDYARFILEEIDLHSAKGNEIVDKFMSSGSFHNGSPYVMGVKAIKNPVLSRLHDEYRKYLATKHREEPMVRELYHGTNNNIHDIVYKHGLQPPSDCQASDACPVSGGKGLCTTLCPNTCKYCTEKHEWDKCHMFGLGIYLADIAQKSHRYVSQPQVLPSGRRMYRMVVCEVLGRAFKVEGHLRCADAMHDVANVRALTDDEVATMIEPCKSASCKRDAAADAPAEKSDMLFIQGLGGRVRPGYSVVNSEYIAFHPHQCLPKYEITYGLY